MRIMSNIPALQSYNALTATNNALSKSIERLSTGLRINGAADDAAGLAISEKMRAQVRGLNQATSNAQDGISMIQTAEGALGETHSILQRMRELSVQASNDTLTSEDRTYIQLEIDQLKEEVSRIATTTQFNKRKLLDGSAAVLWSADDLDTKAIVNGGLRMVDQFGQKSAAEGNFKITVNAEPGTSQVQKSDIFKIKHKNVIMNASFDSNAGYVKVSVDNLPAGTYNVYERAAITTYTLTMTTVTTFQVGEALFTTVTGAGGFAAAQVGIEEGKLVYVVSANAQGRGMMYNGFYYSPASRIVIADNFATTTGGPLTIAAGGVTSGAAGVGAAEWGKIKTELNAVYDKFAGASAHNQIVRVSNDKSSFQFGGFYGLTSGNAGISISTTAMGNIENMSILLEVKNVNTATKVITFQAQVRSMDAYGKVTTYSDNNLMIGSAGVSQGYDKLGIIFVGKSAISINGIGAYDKGDKLVLNLMSTDKDATTRITLSGQLNQEWVDAWDDKDGTEVGYNVQAESFRGKDIQFQNYYLNSENGTTYESKATISFNQNIKKSSAATNVSRGSFEAAYIGQVAQGDVKLRDIDKFWDSNGRFLLEDAKEITIYQGNGTNAKFSLYATDTLDDVRQKLNDAIAFGLGQSKYVSEASDNFVSFVETPTPNSDESVAGTFIIRSLIPGSAGELNFSGDEEVIRAFSLNVIQQPLENTFNVSVYDAHTAKIVATNQKISGNVLVGVLHPNIDVVFDPMANIKASWNDLTHRFDLVKEEGTYETILHLSDNTTVFQVGANEGEDMGIDIGDMSALALGITNVIVTDRDSAARSITVLDNAIGKVSKQRARLGAYQNRLEHTISNLTTASTNTTAAESRIRDADMAKEMMEFTKLNILSQAGNSMLAQANQLPQNVLSLLRG